MPPDGFEVREAHRDSNAPRPYFGCCIQQGCDARPVRARDIIPDLQEVVKLRDC